jgi:hypothetical protein
MGAHMKTTIKINDALLTQAKEIASQRQQTLKSIIEAALRQFIDANNETAVPFKMRKCSFWSHGLPSHLLPEDWDEIRAQIYEGRGG